MTQRRPRTRSSRLVLVGAAAAAVAASSSSVGHFPVPVPAVVEAFASAPSPGRGGGGAPRRSTVLVHRHGSAADSDGGAGGGGAEEEAAASASSGSAALPASISGRGRGRGGLLPADAPPRASSIGGGGFVRSPPRRQQQRLPGRAVGPTVGGGGGGRGGGGGGRYGPLAASPGALAQPGVQPRRQLQRQQPSWSDRLTSISSVASLLCVIDCTVLPVATVVLPLLGIASGGGGEWLHALGHAVAMYFVLPVGTLATATAYLNHRTPLLTAPPILGMSLIYLANAPPAVSSHLLALLSLPHGWAHALHCGTVVHRVVNLVGCALMLGGNWLARRASGDDGCALPGCGRDDCRTESDYFFRW